MTAGHHLIQRKALSKRTHLLGDQVVQAQSLIEYVAKIASDHFSVAMYVMYEVRNRALLA